MTQYKTPHSSYFWSACRDGTAVQSRVARGGYISCDGREFIGRARVLRRHRAAAIACCWSTAASPPDPPPTLRRRQGRGGVRDRVAAGGTAAALPASATSGRCCNSPFYRTPSPLPRLHAGKRPRPPRQLLQTDGGASGSTWERDVGDAHAAAAAGEQTEPAVSIKRCGLSLKDLDELHTNCT